MALGSAVLHAGAGHAEDAVMSPRHTPLPGTVARCVLTAGHPAFCGAPYTGRAVLLQQGVYNMCDVTLGAARFCYGPYTGQAVIWQGRSGYARCDLTTGRVTFCYQPYTGKAVIPQNAE
ncbi:hypothetical protein OQ252_09580 [Acetobacter farinalis]|uniref:Alcohol dehydrogenase n=1 Tax=Acetobacter farinalis TaxID=1260984 RepID=A0ABT3Q8M5_9PROT|nr:hypothetical protein [Acetobacter farinalis]MCX2561643.1 hypothetical protein [Acetobacter farinalis]